MSGALTVLDWGTTHVRAALLDQVGTVLEEREGISGIGRDDAKQLAVRFDDLVADWPIVPAIAAGMIGSRQGWQEAAYVDLPVSTDQLAQSLTQFQHNERTIAIVPGLAVKADDHHDVMRGEESQIAGLIAQNPKLDATLILPGSHSKWVRVDKGAVTSFQTYLTGEAFKAFGEHTILRHSIAENQSSWNMSAFDEALKDYHARPGSIWGQLFPIRAAMLLGAEKVKSARESLSAALIVQEFQAAMQDGFNAKTVHIIGGAMLCDLYSTAAKTFGMQVHRHDGKQLIWPALFTMARSAGLLKG